ncbi:50S ribosomal protein L22 [Candidatus Falkowbacteria bacterium]|nr:50S ribosomal protein L22 [Candidatus Falkowbacteria bacterium]
MEVKAKARYIRISPKKVRLVLALVRGVDAEEALKQLQFINKAAARPVKKLLDSAIANATNNFSLDKSNLFIKEIRADEGPTLKRWKPRAFGRATPLRKKSSHISIVLGERVESKDVEKKEQKLDAPVKISELAKSDGKKSEDGKLKMEDGKKKETRDKKLETRDEAEDVKLDSAGNLIKKERKGLEDMRKKERKGFFKSVFSRKTGQK